MQYKPTNTNKRTSEWEKNVEPIQWRGDKEKNSKTKQNKMKHISFANVCNTHEQTAEWSRIICKFHANIWQMNNETMTKTETHSKNMQIFFYLFFFSLLFVAFAILHANDSH